jgi:hypothetical protein
MAGMTTNDGDNDDMSPRHHYPQTTERLGETKRGTAG